jgi:hypothetical protein
MAKFNPGFRISVIDVLVLLAAAWGTWFVGREVWWAGAIVAFVVGHFFLFCNVFRICRKAELQWAAVFVVLSGLTIATDYPGWWATFALSLLATVVLVWRETRKPSYHGIGWKRWNPALKIQHAEKA